MLITVVFVRLETTSAKVGFAGEKTLPPSEASPYTLSWKVMVVEKFVDAATFHNGRHDESKSMQTSVQARVRSLIQSPVKD